MGCACTCLTFTKMVSAIRKSPRNSGEEEGEPASAISVRPITAPRWPKPALSIAVLVVRSCAGYQFTDLSTPSNTGARALSVLASIPEKSIAVLPFENLSAEKENAYFADGVQDEILTAFPELPT